MSGRAIFPGSNRRAAPRTEDEVTERQKLVSEIYELGKVINANALAFKAKPMSEYDREALRRQMTTRVAHLKLMQQRLDRLSNKIIADRSSWPVR
jgi:hypothetical protein